MAAEVLTLPCYEVDPTVDVAPLRAALPEKGEVTDVFGVAQTLREVQPTLMAAGLPDGFNYVYGELSWNIGEEARKPDHRFRSMESLNRTSPIFLDYYLDALRDYIAAVDYAQTGEGEPRHLSDMAPHWQQALLDPRVKEADRGLQFLVGMGTHINYDLMLALTDADPDWQQYVHDYMEAVTDFIGETSWDLAPEIVPGHESLRRAPLALMLPYIFGIRFGASWKYRKLAKMPQALHAEYVQKQSERVTRKNERNILFGRTVMHALARTEQLPIPAKPTKKIVEGVVKFVNPGIRKLVRIGMGVHSTLSKAA